MSGGTLSQEEINALINGGTINSGADDTNGSGADALTSEEIDILGEIGNISMGTAATTLFSLLNHKVTITTPAVEELTLDDFIAELKAPHIAVSVGYTVGLTGTNVMILGEDEVKIITDLMMGGEGKASEEPISELHLSAISEAMNQMIGSGSTSLSQMFGTKVDISPPKAAQISDARAYLNEVLDGETQLVRISFRLEILSNIIDTSLMQIVPIKYAKQWVNNLLQNQQQASSPAPTPVAAPAPTPVAAPTPVTQAPASMQPQYGVQATQPLRNVEVQTPHFEQFDMLTSQTSKENMNILLDVSLEISAELGRTKKKIKEILEFSPGSVVELNRLVGEPIDILVNGKFIAKGEVVVIDENFGVRIVDIISPENRI